MTPVPASQSAILGAVGGVVGGAFLMGVTAVVLVVVLKKRKWRDKNRDGKGRKLPYIRTSTLIPDLHHECIHNNKHKKSDVYVLHDIACITMRRIINCEVFTIHTLHVHATLVLQITTSGILYTCLSSLLGLQIQWTTQPMMKVFV